MDLPMFSVTFHCRLQNKLPKNKFYCRILTLLFLNNEALSERYNYGIRIRKKVKTQPKGADDVVYKGMVKYHNAFRPKKKSTWINTYNLYGYKKYTHKNVLEKVKLFP